MHRYLKGWLPPALTLILTRIRNRYGWFGDYQCWKDAMHKSTGYDDRLILESVKSAMLKVKYGKAIYERDSVVFDQVHYSWPVLSALMWVAAQNNGNLDLVDYGGSLGSTYFQNSKFLKNLKSVSWSVVEQNRFVECGKEHFENKILKFYETIDLCQQERSPDTLILSSVVQYLKEPYSFLDMIQEYNFKYVIIDRTPFVAGKERLTVQKVPPDIYPASYPAWFFNKSKFLSHFTGKYNLVEEFTSDDRANIDSIFLGFILRRRDDC